MAPSCAIVLRPSDPPSPLVSAAEARLARLVADVTAADAQIEQLSRELASFEVRWREATEAATAELDRAQRLARAVERLRGELGRVEAELRGAAEPPRAARPAPRPPDDARRVRPRRADPEERRAAPRPAPSPDEPLEDLKTLYRRLARLLHPDLARGDAADRQRRSDLMARANEAWRRRDRVALELLAERLGAGEPRDGELTERERLAHVQRRTAAMQAALARFAGARTRLEGSPVARLRAEDARRRAEGGDAPAEAAASARDEAARLRARAVRELDALGRAARRLDRELAAAERPRGRGAPSVDAVLGRGPFDADATPTSAARSLAVRLADEARGPAPWGAALTLLAFLAEAAGRAPAPLDDVAELSARWDALRVEWPDAPELGRALAELPRAVELGLRAAEGGVAVGLRLTSPELAPGVRLALEDAEVRALAARVLLALGPREACPRCEATVYAVHLLRLRGLDEVHGLACPRCAAVLRTFFVYGPPRGLAALGRWAAASGVVAEVPLRLGRARLGLQLLPADRARLTARTLLRRFGELCLAPHGLELPRGALALLASGRPLAAGARVPEGARLALACAASAGMSEAELARLVRAGARRRFRS